MIELRCLLISALLLASGGRHVLAQDPAPGKSAVTPSEKDAPPTDGEKKPEDKDAKPEAPAEKAEEESEIDEDAVKEVEDAFQAMERLTKALELIREKYVDEKKVTYDRLITSAIRGILEDLDPHCQYLAPQVFEQLKQNQDDSYEGVGITVAPKNDSIVIVTVREDGPAARAGVMPGDTLLKVGEFTADKLGYLEIVKLLKGKPGEKLKITIYRPNTKETKEFEMVREVMRQDSVRDAMLLDPAMTGGHKIGYVRILQFNQPTAKELGEALDALEAKGMQAMILDLRNNPGGLLTSAVDVCGEFLAPDTQVVTTEGRAEGGSGPQPAYRTKNRNKPNREYPLAVLINNSSASGSELTAGALQDLNRAIIVGETSFGKGSVQTIIPNRDGTAIRITTAKYFTPSRKMIHEHGIVPNITATLTPEEEQRIFEWRRNHTQGSADPAQLAKLNDRQLERAVTALAGVLVLKAKPQINTTPPPVAQPKAPELKFGRPTQAPNPQLQP